MIGSGSEEHKVAQVIHAYQAVSLTIAAFALFWTVIFFLDGHPVMAAAEFFPVVAGLIWFVLVTKGRLDLFLIVAAGCHIFQGYLFGRSMPLADFELSVIAPQPRAGAIPERPSPRLAAG